MDPVARPTSCPRTVVRGTEACVTSRIVSVALDAPGDDAPAG